MSQRFVVREGEFRTFDEKPADRDWRCRRCDKLLGRVVDDRVHLRFARQHEYHAALPASCTCRSCGALNELSRPTPTRAA